MTPLCVWGGGVETPAWGLEGCSLPPPPPPPWEHQESWLETLPALGVCFGCSDPPCLCLLGFVPPQEVPQRCWLCPRHTGMDIDPSVGPRMGYGSPVKRGQWVTNRKAYFPFPRWMRVLDFGLTTGCEGSCFGDLYSETTRGQGTPEQLTEPSPPSLSHSTSLEFCAKWGERTRSRSLGTGRRTCQVFEKYD